MALIIAVGGGLALMVFLASHEEAERATVGSAVEV
jgi:hypothetical protein